MSDSAPVIPVVLFAYERAEHLARALACMRENAVPLILAYSDGPKSSAHAPGVAQVRQMLREIDWTEVRITERPQNLGLGKNVLAGVTEVAAAHEMFIVWEDDLIAVPGTYDWMCAALRHYQSTPQVMSVSGWTHPRVTPPDIVDTTYFDGRSECWLWGSYARAWSGMDQSALAKIAALAKKGIAPNTYGDDLPLMAAREKSKNIWAVRWLYHHLQYGGLCLRPPWSMVEHIGFDQTATHASAELGWHNPPLQAAPAIGNWPAVIEHPACQGIWKMAAQAAPGGIGARLKRGLKRIVPAFVLSPIQRRFFRVRWEGHFSSWAAAEKASAGYDRETITRRLVRAARLVRDGACPYERDGVTFTTPPPPWFAHQAFISLAAALNRQINVLDFGGALGSQFFQHRALKPFKFGWRWSVVEQPHLAKIGQREFQSAELRFFESVNDAIIHHAPDVLLLGSVLPYLQSPLETLAELLSARPQLVIVERTAFVTAGDARLTVQRVPRSIYPASYPCWFLSRAAFEATMGDAYEMIFDQGDPIETPAGLEFRSFIFKRIEA